MLKKWLAAAVVAFASISQVAKADEGMWLPMFLNKNIEEMQKMGLNLTPEQLYDINNSSLKDAIVSFGGFCTGEIISNNGLILTNHHCGYEAIQTHSTVENNILDDGFWAANHGEEKQNEGLFVEFLVRMDDVTSKVLASVNDNMSEAERAEAVHKAIGEISAKAKGETNYRIEIKPFFDGNEYYQFTYERYNDVRLVGAPPSSVGKYGGDTDNWMWPRQTGDFSMFRVYTAPDGSPAHYSENNVPMAPKHHLPISMKGVKPNDYTMIWGYPGGTDRYLTSYGIEQAVERENPPFIDVRRTKLDILDKHMVDNEAVRIKYSAKYAQTSNYWKNFIGMTKALKALKVQDLKEDIEKDFTNWVNQSADRKAKYGEALSLIKNSYAETDELIAASIYAREAALTGPDISLFALRLSRSVEAMLKEGAPEAQREAIKASLPEMVKEHFKNYDLAADKELFVTLMSKYNNDVKEADLKPGFFTDVKKGDFQKFANKAYAKSMFVNEEKVLKFLEEPSLKTLKKDPLYDVQNSIYNTYLEFGAKMESAMDKASKGNRLFVDGLRKMNPDKNYYPNANFTMRCTYGTVSGYSPQDGAFYEYYTTLNGVMQKMDNSNPEFVVPNRLVELYENKDYGKYADKDGELRVCFISNNDITGGNSGSPVINGDGELVGCAFDGNWEAMSGDIHFEDQMQRTISVDIRYVLFIIDKYAGAKHIVDEMTLVY
ncbi:MAG: S46 family peptidase [Flavobacteriales bacterium]